MTVSAPDDRNLLVTLLSASAVQCLPGGWAVTANQLSLSEEVPMEETPGLLGSGHEGVVLKVILRLSTPFFGAGA